MKTSSYLILGLALASCGGTQSANTGNQASSEPSGSPSSGAPVAMQPPPAPGPRRDIHFPAIARSTLANGLEVNVVEYHALPVIHIRLVARAAGSSADPANMPGLAAFTGDMLKEGTRTKTSAQIAEAIEFVGGSLSVATGPDDTTINVSVLRDHAEEALALITDLISDPIFPQSEIDKLRRREDDRLTQMAEDPAWLSRRAFYQALYGSHPYAQIDTSPEALRRLSREEIVNFHRARYLAGSMFLAVVGDVHPADFTPMAERTVGHLRRGTAPAPHFPALTPRTSREVIIVDRPESAQSVIRIGNLALRRASDDYVPLAVANQILGGDAASRLFMELREHRSLTYGAYSRVSAAVDIGAFQASGSVRTPVTAEALAAFFEQLDLIDHQAAPDGELEAARSYLIDSFPLAVETASDLAGLLVDLRRYGFADTYWDTYRAHIAEVTGTQALEAARRYVHPEQSVIVIVGPAATFEENARQYGPVRVVNVAGQTLRTLTAQPASAAPSSHP